ncbi:MAG TPA: DUF2975 domain-containing protein [Patescibacteria group bacterium]|nr:DUF2975 domain-containing protein [Patescibacteria group bacterium]
MKRGSTWFLRAVLVLLGLIAAAVCVFGLPPIFRGASSEYPGARVLLYFLIAGITISVVPFFIALYQAWKLLNYIDSNRAFSQISVNALGSIKYCSIAMSICYAVGIPYLFHVAQLDDAPGLGLIALAFASSPLVVATFAAVLEKLLQSAINIKSENDLTI